jgi:putative transposase
MPRRKEPRIPDAVLDQLLADADPQAVFDPNGLLDALKKALAERVLNAEMDHHLAGEEPAIGEMGMARRHSLPTPARSSRRFRGTAKPALIRS